VQNVDVLLHGNATYESITDENGQYTFTNIPKGDYTIEASRKVDTLDDSISPMDASVIARSIVRLQELSCYEFNW
jgi:Cna protein B-type domain.